MFLLPAACRLPEVRRLVPQRGNGYGELAAQPDIGLVVIHAAVPVAVPFEGRQIEGELEPAGIVALQQAQWRCQRKIGTQGYQGATR